MIRKIIFFLILTLTAGFLFLPVSAQNFSYSEYSLPQVATDLEVVDLDKDGQFELVMILQMGPLNSKVVIYNTDLDLQREYLLSDVDELKLHCQDLNNDGRAELIVSGKKAGNPYIEILINRNNFLFQSFNGEVPQLIHPFQIIDINHDGKLDFIGKQNSHPDSLNRAYLNELTGFKECADCNFTLTGLPLEKMDLFNDGILDLIMHEETGLEVIENIALTDSVIHKIPVQFSGFSQAYGDINGDGFDEIIAPESVDGTNYLAVITRSGASFQTLERFEVTAIPNQLLLADLTNDGQLDILSLEAGQLQIYISSGNSFSERLNLASGVVQAFAVGDTDNDKDLDIFLTGTINNESYARVIKNGHISNAPPTNPRELELFSFPKGDTVQFVWSSGTDDTTPAGSLSYELLVYDEAGNSVMPVNTYNANYNSGPGDRLHAKFYSLRNLSEGRYRWAVLSIDNSFSIRNGTGLCWAEFNVEPANEPIYTVCRGDTVNFKVPTGEITRWYSSSRGFLEQTDSLAVIAEESETIYANYYIGNYLTTTYKVIVEVSEPYEISLVDFYGCSGDVISYALQGPLKEASWQFLETGEIYVGSSIAVLADKADDLVITVTNLAGCISNDTISINVEPIPAIDAGPDVEIVIDESTQLSAAGGQTYQWSPTGSLDDPFSANPVASPRVTTTYTVTGYSALGCSSTDEVIVNVKDRVILEEVKLAFVPNLFSPNGDGVNDTFKVYGDGIASATLKVFNQSGIEVFTGKILGNDSPAWDGTINGNPAPQGIYVWSLSGNYANGESINEIGPSGGTVTLVR